MRAGRSAVAFGLSVTLAILLIATLVAPCCGQYTYDQTQPRRRQRLTVMDQMPRQQQQLLMLNQLTASERRRNNNHGSRCPSACSYNFAPLCARELGTNRHVMFANGCRLMVANCRQSSRRYMFAYTGPCKSREFQ